MSAMEVRLLGPVEVDIGGHVLPLRRRQERCLLAILALDPGRAISVERLTDLLWEDQPPAQPRAAVQAMVSHLRAALRPAESSGVALIGRGASYRLEIAQDRVDAHRFRTLVDSSRSASTGEERAALLDRGLRLWRGPALADAADGEQRLRLCRGLDELHLVASEEALEARLDLGQHREAISELVRLSDEYPGRERLTGLLMVALYRAGRKVEALQAYAELARGLRDGTGLDPDESIQMLQRRILGDDPHLLHHPPTETHDRPPHDEPPHDEPPRGPGPSQLPTLPGVFVGRRFELRQLDELYANARTDAPVITVIAGTAGVGKSALAVEWAHRVARRFRDGQIYLDLRGYATAPAMRPIEALAVLLGALGVPAAQVPTDLDSATGIYRSQLAGRRVLIVLDNASSPQQVRPLLPGSPGSQVVVTSRDRLTGLIVREGAKRVGLDVLGVDESRELLVGLLSVPRVTNEVAAADALARTCAHLPLALRIAAADLIDHPDRSIAEQVDRLDSGDRLALLQIEGDHLSAVRATFDLSYVTLPPDAQRLFCLLGHIPGHDISVEAAGVLATTPETEVRRLLDLLVRACLLRELPQGRYTFHDLLRCYAVDCATQHMSAADNEATARRILLWYLRSADVAAQQLYPHMFRLALPDTPEVPGATFADQPGALAWLNAERTNLVAAVDYAVKHGHPVIASRLADTLRGYFWQGRYSIDWLHVAQSGLDAAVAEGDLLAQAALKISLGMAYHRSEKLPMAIDHYLAAEERARRLGWLEGLAAALGNLGVAYHDNDDLELAAHHYDRARDIYEQLGNVPGQAISIGNVGAVCQRLGRLADAAAAQALSMKLHEQTGSPTGRAHAAANLGHVEYLLGHLDRAETLLTEALRSNQDAGSRFAEDETLCYLAAVQHARGRYDEASATASAALALAREIAERRTEAKALNLIGNIRLSQGRAADAIGTHRHALEVAEVARAHYVQTGALLGLGTAYRAAGEHDLAGSYADQALDVARKYGYRVLEGLSCDLKAALAYDAGRHDIAERYARDGQALHRDTGHAHGAVENAALLARIGAHADDRPDETARP